MSAQNKVSGLVLAGGMAKRMASQDKGLVLFQQQPLISYALAAISPLVDELFISANRNLNSYRQFGYPVISDHNKHFDGPLAGILAGMQAAQHSLLLVMPCDSPLVEASHLQCLVTALTDDTEITIACDEQGLHPVFLALKTHLHSSLADYLQRGERKLSTWIQQHNYIKVDFSNTPDIFTNINTLQELTELEANYPSG